MYGVWDDASVGVGWKEGCWVVVVVIIMIFVVFVIPTVVTMIVLGMYQLSWQGRVGMHGI